MSTPFGPGRRNEQGDTGSTVKRSLPRTPEGWLREIRLAIKDARETEPFGRMIGQPLEAGQNPPDGVIVTYYLKEKPQGEIKLTFLTADGKEIRSFTSEEEEETPANGKNGTQTAIETEEEEKKKP